MDLQACFWGLSPIGINFTSITVSLAATVLVLAVVALVRNRREISSVQVQGSQQVSSLN